MCYFYILSTPIGNLEDLSYRLISMLYYADILIVENKKNMLNLLKYIGLNPIYKKIISIRHLKSLNLSKFVVNSIKSKIFIILSSDAGTPIINDPGNFLINKIRLKGYTVNIIPGPSSLISAVVTSGLINHRFIFLGFLPRNSFKTESILINSFLNGFTLILYESPLRLNKTLSIIYDYYKETRIVIIRELTKIYETFHYGILGRFIYPYLFYYGECILIIEHPKFRID